MKVFSGISLMLFAISAYPQTSSLRAGEALVLARDDGSGLVMVSNDNPVIWFVEVDGDVVAVRVTPIDRSGATVGGGRVIMVGAGEERVMRLRDEFAKEVLYNAGLRVEVLQGQGGVMLSSTEEYGRGLRPRTNATSSRRRAVSPPGPTPTSRKLIDKAEAAGTISSESALLYRVYDIFSDARLPQQYRGDDSEITEGMYLNEVRNRYPTLSAATQAAVMPFLIPPIYKNSWANSEHPVSSVSDNGPPICSDRDTTWDSVTTFNGAVRIWYRLSSPDLSRAVALADMIDLTIWPNLKDLMKNVPKSDEAVPNCNAGEGRLDLYLTDITRSHAVSLEGCNNTSVFIEMNRTAKDRTVIHELMHAFQFSYPLKGCIGDHSYNWWTEGSAMFAEDFVSKATPPPDNEHFVAKYFLDQPWESLDFINDFHEYGTYLLPFYVHRSTGNADFVSATWKRCADEPALEAFDHSVAGGFEKVWFDFVRFNFNREGFDDYFKWDGLRHKSALYGTETILSGGMDQVDPITVDLPVLSAIYRYYIFSEEEWSSVAFWNGVNFNLKLHEPAPGAGVQYDPAEGDADATKGARVQALIKIGDKWTHEDWTRKPFVTFCRDMTAERIVELVVIISNSEFKDRGHRVKTGGGGLPVLFVSNMGCWQWKGTVTYSNPMGVNVSTTATWTRAEQSQSPPFVLYQAKGTQDWNFAGVCSGSGKLDLMPELSFLFTYNFAPIQGAFHRVSNAIGATTSQVLLNCPPNPAPVPAGLPAWITFPPLPTFGGIPGARFVKVREDGTTIKDSYTFLDGAVWTWDFKAERQ